MPPLSNPRQCVEIQCDIIQNGFISLRRPRVDQLMQLNVTNLHKACQCFSQKLCNHERNNVSRCSCLTMLAASSYLYSSNNNHMFLREGQFLCACFPKPQLYSAGIPLIALMGHGGSRWYSNKITL